MDHCGFQDHLQRGVAGGFVQANHGKSAPLKRMHKGDWILFYSPRTEFEKPEKLQCFTAICKLTDDEIYQHDMGGGFIPFRRNAKFLPVQDVSILPLIAELSFIKDKIHWGAPFRFGTLEIPEMDFRLVAAKMLENQSLLME